MTFSRASIIAMMAKLLSRGNVGLVYYLVVLVAGALLRFFTTDLLPAAIDRGIKAFKEGHMR